MTENTSTYGSIQPHGFPSLPEGWVSDWEIFPSSDEKLKLFSVLHHTKNWQGKRTLVVVHGFGEHGGRYLHVPHYVNPVVDAVFCADLRGHGRSEGIRGHVDRFDLYCEDVAFEIRRLNQYLAGRFGRSEIHLLGHSLGGLVALRTLLKDHDLPIRSAFISAPCIKVKLPVPLAKRMAALALSRIWGSLQLKADVDAGLLSHDPHVADAYVADRLIHSKGTPAFYTGLLDAQADTRKCTDGIRVPLMMWIPMKDGVVDSNAALTYFHSLKNKNKFLKTDPEFYHEILNEIGKEKVFEDLKQWISAQSEV